MGGARRGEETKATETEREKGNKTKMTHTGKKNPKPEEEQVKGVVFSSWTPHGAGTLLQS